MCYQRHTTLRLNCHFHSECSGSFIEIGVASVTEGGAVRLGAELLACPSFLVASLRVAEVEKRDEIDLDDTFHSTDECLSFPRKIVATN